jgi:hypothetical protein
MEYESVSEVLFGNAVLTALMYKRKYDISPNGDCSRESNVCTLVFHHQKATSVKNPLWKKSTFK